MRCSSRATIGSWAKPTMAMLRNAVMSGSQSVDVGCLRRVGLAGWAEVLDVVVVALALAVRFPDRFHPHPHAYLFGFTLQNEGEDGDVGAVEGNGGGNVGNLDVAADHRNVDDAECRENTAVGDLDEGVARREALRRTDQRRHEHL